MEISYIVILLSKPLNYVVAIGIEKSYQGHKIYQQVKETVIKSFNFDYQEISYLWCRNQHKKHLQCNCNVKKFKCLKLNVAFNNKKTQHFNNYDGKLIADYQHQECQSMLDAFTGFRNTYKRFLIYIFHNEVLKTYIKNNRNEQMSVRQYLIKHNLTCFHINWGKQSKLTDTCIDKLYTCTENFLIF